MILLLLITLILLLIFSDYWYYDYYYFFIFISSLFHIFHCRFLHYFLHFPFFHFSSFSITLYIISFIFFPSSSSLFSISLRHYFFSLSSFRFHYFFFIFRFSHTLICASAICPLTAHVAATRAPARRMLSAHYARYVEKMLPIKMSRWCDDDDMRRVFLSPCLLLFFISSFVISFIIGHWIIYWLDYLVYIGSFSHCIVFRDTSSLVIFEKAFIRYFLKAFEYINNIIEIDNNI